MTAQFVKVSATSQKHGSAYGVGAGTKGVLALQRTQQGWALGNMVCWGLGLPAHLELG